jgi:thiol-disulfide isomerase/thioredoxin
MSMKILGMVKYLLLIVGLTTSLSAAGFNVQNFKYQTVNINDVVGDGRWTLVMIWTTDCVPCEEQKPMIQEFHDAHFESNARVIGIAADGMGKIDEISGIIERHKTTYPNYIADAKTFKDDYAGLTKKKYRATPTYILFDPDGAMKGVAVGPISRDKLEAAVN